MISTQQGLQQFCRWLAPKVAPFFIIYTLCLLAVLSVYEAHLSMMQRFGLVTVAWVGPLIVSWIFFRLAWLPLARKGKLPINWR